MNLVGARIADGPTASSRRDIYLEGGRISFDEPPHGSSKLDLGGFLVLPGLINAHDHLEFNLFPRLGRGFYANAKTWANDIYRPMESPIKEHLALNKRTRMLWGALKNLLSGVTTVAHHNQVGDFAHDESFPVKVADRFGWAHSLDFSPDLVPRFRATPSDWPFILHAAEGIDETAGMEIAKLDALGVLSERTVLVHAIGLDQPDLPILSARRSAIVWCPTSNFSIYGRTIDAAVLRSGVPVALGTDSALTAHVDLLDEIAAIPRPYGLSAEQIYSMVTERPAQILRLTDGEGAIRDGGAADLVAIADQCQTPAEALEQMTPELVIVRGKIRLVSEKLSGRIPVSDQARMHRVAIAGRGRYFTDVDVPRLHEDTFAVLGADYRLAGKRVSLC